MLFVWLLCLCLNDMGVCLDHVTLSHCSLTAKHDTVPTHDTHYFANSELLKSASLIGFQKTKKTYNMWCNCCHPKCCPLHFPNLHVFPQLSPADG